MKDIMLRYFDLGKQTFVFTDAHVTGFGAILAQGVDIQDAKPIAFASRATTPAESRYPQLDLDAMGIDYGLRRLRNYLIGAPQIITIVTDHKPLCAVFSGNRMGSIRTERIKLRHQDIRFKVEYQAGKKNQADLLSRNAKPFSKLSPREKTESEDLNNLLYVLHTAPITDTITLAKIATETSADDTLRDLRTIIHKGQTWIPKTASKQLQKFKQILPTITVTGNGILLKDDRIILPKSLQREAIVLAHQGNHPGQSGIECRLWYHFFFHNMDVGIENFINTCGDCQIFTDKRTMEPIKAHTVPDRCWSHVAVDLFGPMPSSKHIVVVQDLKSRLPAAKIVTSTKASIAIPAIADIYDSFGNPENQLSDNGCPFNSRAMEDFATKRNINLQKIPPLHPSANPVETFMKPLGKTMKIAKHNNASEKQALSQLLSNYRDTPHPATGISPAMFFRNPPNSIFPRVDTDDNEIAAAYVKDNTTKQVREDNINSLKYRKYSQFKEGEVVLIRNLNKSSKYDPVFQPLPCTIVAIADKGRRLTLERDGKTYCWHPDDVKRYINTNNDKEACNIQYTEEDIILAFHRALKDVISDTSECIDSECNEGIEQHNQQPIQIPANNVREPSSRRRTPNSRIFNEDFENY